MSCPRISAFSEQDEDNLSQGISEPRSSVRVLLEDSASKVKRLQTEGNTLAECGRFRAAIDRWQEAIAMDPTNAVLHELMAQGCMAGCEDFRAVQFAQKATDLAPDWADGYQTLGRALLNFGELELAMQSIRKAIDLGGENDELVAERDEIDRLLRAQEMILREKDAAAKQEHDSARLQVISCMKHLALRGRAGSS
ncbi:hypothetical protein PINS_up003611 [Pythium insidiosum]|nr:hypothetical protein PINS_up003611 [Pythium insidiosum]